MTYYGLKFLSWAGLIWDLRAVPKAVIEEGLPPRQRSA
jgi:hypothetical protein